MGGGGHPGISPPEKVEEIRRINYSKGRKGRTKSCRKGKKKGNKKKKRKGKRHYRDNVFPFQQSSFRFVFLQISFYTKKFTKFT